MPFIPTEKTPQILPGGELQSQHIGVDPAAFGAATAQGLGQAAQSTNDMALRDLQIQNETARVGAENQLLQSTLDLQNGNKDKGVVGYRSLVGQNAIDAFPDYQQKLQDAYKDIRGGLNPAAARMFDQSAFRIMRGAQDGMGAYKSQQEVVQAHTESRDRVRLAQEGALSDADDPAKWDAHLGNVQEASLAGSRTLGLGPDATEANRRADLSAVFEDRTKQLALRDPMSAADFYHQNIGMVVPEKRYEIERMLKVTTDGQYARGDGQTAYTKAIAPPANTAPAPQNFNAPDLQPIDQKRVDSIVKFVKSPTPYDDIIDAAAKQYNVNPAEIKLKIAMESGGNAKAVNPKSGTAGLAQLTSDTAARLGVTDRTDPQQAIGAVARLLSEGGGTTGSDMSSADRYYYGGNTNARGPNTNQYAENSRVVRQALFGATPPPPPSITDMEGKEADVIKAAQVQAEARRPGDPVYRDQVVQEARRQWSVDLAALKGKEYQNYSGVLGMSVDPQNPVRSLTDLPGEAQQTFAQLTPEHQYSLQRLWNTAQRQDNRTATPDDTRKLLALEGQATSDPVAFKSRDIASDIADLPPQYQTRVLNLYGAIDKDQAKGVSYTRALNNPNVLHMLESARIAIPSPSQKKDTTDYNVFAGRMRQELDTFFAQNKRNPTDAELTKLSGTLLTPGKLSRSWLPDVDTPAFKVGDGDMSRFYVPVPPEQKAQLAASYAKKMGRQPSDGELQDAYTRYRLAGGK